MEPWQKKIFVRRLGLTFLVLFLLVEGLLSAMVAGGPAATWGMLMLIGFLICLWGGLAISPIVIGIVGTTVPASPRTRKPKPPRPPKPLKLPRAVRRKEEAEELIRRLRAEKRDRHVKDLAAFDRVFKAYEGKGRSDD